jgi:hypothetical protein
MTKISPLPNRRVSEKVDILCGEFRAGGNIRRGIAKGGVHLETKCGIMSHGVMKHDVIQSQSRFSYLKVLWKVLTWLFGSHFWSPLQLAVPLRYAHPIPISRLTTS